MARTNRSYPGRPVNTLRITPNPVLCSFTGYTSHCFPKHATTAHARCWRNHFGLTPAHTLSHVGSIKNQFTRADFQCVYCGSKLTPKNATVDHVIPHSRGGSKTDRMNQAPACKNCNSNKGPMTAAEYLGVRDDTQARKQLLAKLSALFQNPELGLRS